MSAIQKFVLSLGLFFVASGVGILTYDRVLQDGVFSGKAGKKGNFTDREEALARLKEAEEYLRQNTEGSARDAMKLFTRVLSLDIDEGTNQFARYGLGVALERLDDIETALAHYRKLDKEKIKDPLLSEKVKYRLGKTLLSINHEEEGRAILERLLSETHNDEIKSDVHTVLGFQNMKEGNSENAKENFSIALKYNPENLKAEMGRASAYKNIKRSASYDYYDDFLIGNSNLNPATKKNVYNALKFESYEKGLSAYRSGKYADAVFYFNKSINSYTDALIQEKSMYWLAESYLALGNSRKAVENFKRVSQNAESLMDQPALIKLGIINFEKNNYKAASQFFKKAMDDYPDGKYTPRAKEWMDETLNLMNEKNNLESIDSEK